METEDLSTVDFSFMQVDDKTGRVTGGFRTYAVCGYIRGMVSLMEGKRVTLCEHIIEELWDVPINSIDTTCVLIMYVYF